MKLMPRSLFVRSALLIASLIIVSQLVTMLLFIYFVQRPRVLMMVDMADSHLQSVRSAIGLIPEGTRKDFLESLGRNTALHLQAESPLRTKNDLPSSLAIRKFLQHFQNTLKPNEQVIYQSQPIQALWVKILVDETPYWVRFDAQQFDSNFGDHWIDISLLMASLALVGGYIIHRTINQPLQRLSQSVSEIGKGMRINEIEEDGPDEVVAFIRALNRMNADLKKIEEDRALMLAGISHDLRTPITRIQLALEMIGGDFDAGLKKRVIANLDEIENGLTQCLDFARNIDDEPIELIDLNELARLTAAKYKINGYEISLNLCDSAQVRARPFAIERLLKNLVDNAVKYADKDISMTTEHHNNLTILSVKDRGKGIEAGDLELLRRPFFRKNEARTNAAGFGLGLAIIDKIIEAHDAEIRYSEREGGGLEVRVIFKNSEM